MSYDQIGKAYIQLTESLSAKDVLDDYTSNSWLNTQLRSNNPDQSKVQPRIQALDSLQHPIKYGTVYRVLDDMHPQSDDLDKLKVGDTFTDKGYSSTTSSIDAIHNVLIPQMDEYGGEPTHILHIKLGDNAHGIDVNKVLGKHYFENQREVILPRNTTFKKTKEWVDDGIKHHELHIME